ncbi:endonuclease/exonuclease/phosphatase family protein [Nocardiopsis synnemataformans]|uniref:endonuclease/exonuclease/phosphatase family protein n=1 Tax=Nocardiopsis synnemataformans TaxID=61305 RepID=UPI003EBEFF6F
MPNTSLRCMSVNAWRSGIHNPDGTYDNRLPALCESIAAHSPTLVGFQEVNEWAKNDRKLLREVEERLGLTAVDDAFVPGRSTGLLYDPAVMELVEWEPITGSEHTWQGFGGTARFDIGLPFSLSVVVVHLSHQSAPLALHQASLVNDRARRVADRAQPPGAIKAEAAVVLGDVNQPRLHHPAAPPEPLPQELPAANLAYRYIGAPGHEVVDRTVAELFARCRWTDLALHLADLTTDPREQAALLAPTGQGGFAVDRVYVTESVVPASRGLRQVSVPSDHKALVWDLVPVLIDPSLTTRLHR